MRLRYSVRLLDGCVSFINRLFCCIVLFWVRVCVCCVSIERCVVRVLVLIFVCMFSSMIRCVLCVCCVIVVGCGDSVCCRVVLMLVLLLFRFSILCRLVCRVIIMFLIWLVLVVLIVIRVRFGWVCCSCCVSMFEVVVCLGWKLSSIRFCGLCCRFCVDVGVLLFC